MFVFPRRSDQFSQFHRWVDLALLFKKGVGREIAVLEVADKFSGRRTADDLSQSTFCVQNFFLEVPPLQPGNERYTATTLWFSMAKLAESYGRLMKFLRDLLAIVAPKKNESKQAAQIFKSSSTKFAPLVAKAR